VDFQGSYEVINPTPIRQTVYLEFALPSKGTSYDNFELRVGDKPSTNRTPQEGKITEAILMEPGTTVPVTIAYRSRGLDTWQYTFTSNRRGPELPLVDEHQLRRESISRPEPVLPRPGSWPQRAESSTGSIRM